MKKNTPNFSIITIAISFFLILYSFSISGQVCNTPPSTIINSTLEPNNQTAGGDMNSSVPRTVNGWYVSKGTPSIFGGVPPGGGVNSIWMWSYSGGGERIFTCYNFIQGETYTVCLWVRNTNTTSDGNLQILATNGLTPGTHSPTSSQLIDGSFVNNQTWTHLQYTFTANNNYNQLSIYPLKNGPASTPAEQYELQVDLIEVHSTVNATFTVTDFCEGTANNATITGATGGTFTIVSPLGDGASIDGTTGEITNGVGGTTYTIQYEIGSGCSASTTEDVTVNSNPTYTVATTDPSCGNNDGEIVITPGSGFTITEYSIDGGTNTQPGGTFPNLSAGSYTIYIKDNKGCEATGTVPEELVNTGSTDDPSFTLTDFCEGTANLATGIATSGGTFSIISPLGDGATINASTGAITNGVGGTTYTVQYETGGACSASTTEDVTVNASPTYTTSTTAPGCISNNGQIIITPGTGVTITDYSIDGGTTKQTGGTFSNLGSGSYTIYVKDNKGCEATGTESLNTTSNPTIATVSPTDASCNADDGTITVSASGGTGTLSYSLNTGQTSSNGIFTGLPNGNYVVTVKDANGCTATQSVTVGKASGPTLTIVNSNNVSCFGESDGSAEVNATGGTATYNYDWSPAGGNAATATGLAPGTYTVSVEDGSGCTDQLQVTISEPDAITINKTITNSDCGKDNGAITLTVTGGTGNYTYAWDPNVGATDEVTDLATGSYEVTVTDDNGCSEIVSYNVMLGNSFYIEAIPDSVTILQGASVSIHVFVDPNVTIDNILWIPASGLSCTDCKDPIATPDYSTTYIVAVTDDNGCTSTDTVIINVILPCADIFVPNTFSPNSDGLNDLQCVIGECIVSLDFTIFNRWGETVFHTIDQKECWDGTFRGKHVQSGVYVYKLKATLEDGKEVELTGNITVVW